MIASRFLLLNKYRINAGGRILLQEKFGGVAVDDDFESLLADRMIEN